MSDPERSTPFVKFLDTTMHQKTAFYRFQVTVGQDKWIIERRFSQFYKLDQNLRIIPGLIVPASMPGRTIFNSIPSPAVILERASKLKTYISGIFLSFSSNNINTAILAQPDVASTFLVLRFLSLAPEDLLLEGQLVKSQPTKLPTVKTGFLTKIGEMIKSYKIRLFVLADHLYYFKEHEHVNPIGFINLADGSTLETCSDDKTHPYGIVINTSRRRWQLFASTPEEVNEWIASLSAVINTDTVPQFSLAKKDEKEKKKKKEKSKKKSKKDDSDSDSDSDSDFGDIFERRAMTIAPVYEQIDIPEVSSSDARKWKPIFLKYASDGKVGYTRVQAAFIDAGYDFEKAVVDEIVRDAKIQASLNQQKPEEGISQDTFIYLLNCVKWMSGKFDSIDKDREDEITRDSLQAALDSVGFDFSESIVEELCEIVDPHGSGLLDFDDFARLFFWLRYNYKNFTYIAKKESGGFVSDAISIDGLAMLCVDCGLLPASAAGGKIKAAGGLLRAVAGAATKFGGKKGAQAAAAASAAAAFADSAAGAPSLDEALKQHGLESVIQFNIIQTISICVSLFARDQTVKKQEAAAQVTKEKKAKVVDGAVTVEVEDGIISAVTHLNPVTKKKKKVEGSEDLPALLIVAAWNPVTDVSILSTYDGKNLSAINTATDDDRRMTWEQPIKGEVKAIKVSEDRRLVVTASFIGYGTENGHGVVIVQTWDSQEHKCIHMTMQNTQDWLTREDAGRIESSFDIAPSRPYEAGHMPATSKRMFLKSDDVHAYDKKERCRLMANIVKHRSIEVFDVIAGHLFCRLIDGDYSDPPFYDVKFMPNIMKDDEVKTKYTYLFAADSEHISVFNYMNNEKVKIIDHPATSVSFSQYAEVLASPGIGSDKSKLKLWDGRARKRLQKLSVGFLSDKERESTETVDERMFVVHNPVMDQIAIIDATGDATLWNFKEEDGDETVTVVAVNSSWTCGKLGEDGAKKWLKDLDPAALAEASGTYHDIGGPALHVEFSADGEYILVVSKATPDPAEEVQEEEESKAKSAIAGLAGGLAGKLAAGMVSEGGDGGSGSIAGVSLPTSVGGISIPKPNLKGLGAKLAATAASTVEGAVGNAMNPEEFPDPSDPLISLPDADVDKVLLQYIPGLSRYSVRRVLGIQEETSDELVISVYLCKNGELVHTIEFNPADESGGLGGVLGAAAGALSGVKMPSGLTSKLPSSVGGISIPKDKLGSMAGSALAALGDMGMGGDGATGPKKLHAHFSSDSTAVIMSHGRRMWMEKMPGDEEEVQEVKSGGGLLGRLTGALGHVSLSDVSGMADKLPGGLGDKLPGGLGDKLPGGLGDKPPGGLGDKLPGGLGGMSVEVKGDPRAFGGLGDGDKKPSLGGLGDKKGGLGGLGDKKGGLGGLGSLGGKGMSDGEGASASFKQPESSFGFGAQIASLGTDNKAETRQAAIIAEAAESEKKTTKKTTKKTKKRKHKYSHLPAPEIYTHHLLMMAVYDDNKSRVSDLIREYQIELDFFFDHLGLSPLMLAVQLGSVKMVRRMLQLGANPNFARDYDGFAPLHLAVLGKRHKIAQKLIESGANADMLWRSYGYAFPPICTKKQWIHQHEDGKKKKKNFKPEEFVCECGLCEHSGIAPLHIAVMTENEPAIRLLLVDEAADVNVMDSSSRPAIEYAIAMHHEIMTKILLEYKPKMLTGSGTPLIHRAAMHGDKALIKKLIRRGAVAGELDKYGRSMEDVFVEVE